MLEAKASKTWPVCFKEVFAFPLHIMLAVIVVLLGQGAVVPLAIVLADILISFPLPGTDVCFTWYTHCLDERDRHVKDQGEIILK